MRASAALVLVGSVASGVVSAQTPSSDAVRETLAEFRSFAVEEMRRQGIVGGSLWIVQDGRVADRIHHGTANLAERRPVDENTIYHWASVTKTLTAVAIMQLRDRGRLRLEDPVVRYIPELRGIHDPFGSPEEITIHHLLSHSAGFRQATWPWGGDESWQPLAPRSWEQVAAMIPYTELLFRPGSRFSYSNLGYVFLGQIIERLTGDDYEVYVDKNVFKPLGMHRSYFDATPYHLLRHRAASYFLKDGAHTPGRPDADTGITVSNGGLNAPLPDMARFLAFLTGARGDETTEADAVLKRPSLEEMWKPVLSATGESREDVSIGLGFFVERRGGETWVGHGGTQNAFVSRLFLSPRLRIGYLFVVNTIGDPDSKDQKGDTPQLNRRIRDEWIGKVVPAMSKSGAAPRRNGR